MAVSLFRFWALFGLVVGSTGLAGPSGLRGHHHRVGKQVHRKACKHSLLQAGREDPPAEGGEEKEGGPADSEIVEGPDCGHSGSVYGKMLKSEKVGKLFGDTSSAITSVEHAQLAVERAAKQGEDAMKEMESLSGGSLDDVQNAIDDATDLATKAGDAATEAASKLDAAKASVEEGGVGGFGISDEAYNDLKGESTKLQVAEKDALASIKAVFEEAEEARKELLGNAKTALKMVSATTAKGVKDLKAAKDKKQKIGWELDKVAAVLEKVPDTEAAIDEKIAEMEASEEEGAAAQKPVLESLKSNVLDFQVSMENSQTELQTLHDDLDKGIPDAEKALDPLNQAEAQAKDTGTTDGLAKMNDKIGEAENKLADLRMLIDKAPHEMELSKTKREKLAKKAEEAAEYDPRKR